MKKVLFLTLFFTFFLSTTLQAQVLFEHTERTYISRNVVHEFTRQVTNAGFLDIHTLTIPLHDPYITLAPVESQRELGMRETALNLLTNSGAIGGVNADFFGLAGTHSLAFGPVIADGQLMSITEHYNHTTNEFAAFFLDENNFPMLRYITPRIWFTVNHVERARVASINKVANVYRPIIINRHGMHSTDSLFARFPDLNKIIVEDGVVSGIRVGPVIVPENGFVVVMNQYNFMAYRPDMWVGMNAEYEVFTNLGRDLSEIQAAVGGGGLILQNGHIVHDTGTAIPGRHPRTALGISGDLNSVILMTVDGRGHSIGATHEDLANLMRQRGATEAMHFDGGGSTTMVAQTDGRGAPLQVVNRVSEGSQRRVMNVLGVFDSSLPGAINQLRITPYEPFVIFGNSINLGLYGLDLYMHRIAPNPANVVFTAYNVDANGERHPAAGIWLENVYLPDRPGTLYVRAQYGEVSIGKTFFVQDITAIQFVNAPITITPYATAPISVNGLTEAGLTLNLRSESGISFSVTPESLGVVENYIFVPANAGSGFITAKKGSFEAHLPVVVGVNNEEEESETPTPAPSPPLPSFADSIRTNTAVAVPGAIDFSLALPGEGALSYSVRAESAAAVLQMTAVNGGIFAADRSQWGRFLNDINMLNPSFVIIRMDANPIRSLSRDEQELFHLALRTQQELGRTVFVVSNAESFPAFRLRDGIRYIDLGNTGENSTINFRIIYGQIFYDF